MVKKPLLVFYALVATFALSRCGTPASQTTESPNSGWTISSSVPAEATMSQPAAIPTVGIESQAPSLPAEVFPSSGDPQTTVSQASPALAAAESLEVRGRSSASAYNREAFGSAWKDVNRNGCDTRNDVLARDFSNVKFRPGTNNCKVIGGVWTDPYSNQSYTFDSAPSGAQIDHVVSLKNAWQMGADLWQDSDRVAFANDPLNLRVTIASLNRQKSDANAASWLPPYKPGRCAFIAQQVAVKTKWKLFVTSAEKTVMVQILSTDMCAGTALPE